MLVFYYTLLLLLLLFLWHTLQRCFSFVFTFQGQPGLPGPKVIKCMLFHPGPLVQCFCYYYYYYWNSETADLHLLPFKKFINTILMYT